jgi:hypothetical protein
MPTNARDSPNLFNIPSFILRMFEKEPSLKSYSGDVQRNTNVKEPVVIG